MTTWTEALPLLEALAALDPLDGLDAPPAGYAWSAWILACGCSTFREQCGQCSARRRVRDLWSARVTLQQEAARVVRLTERAGAGKGGTG